MECQCAGRTGRTPDLRIANGQRGVGHPGTGCPKGPGIDVSPVDMGEFVDADVRHPSGDPLEPGIGTKCTKSKKQTPVAHIMRQRLAAGRTFKAVEKLRVERCLLQDIEKTRHRPVPSDLDLQVDQTSGLRPGSKGRETTRSPTANETSRRSRKPHSALGVILRTDLR